MRKLYVIPAAVACALTLVACGSTMTTDQKYEHLRDVANKGADAHFVLVNENKETTREVCDQHYKVFVPSGAPSEYGGFPATSSKEWEQLSRDYFADSCVKGEPRVIETRSSAPSAPAQGQTSESTPAAVNGS